MTERAARLVANGGFHTARQWRELKAYYDYHCLCCGKREPEIRLTKDHILPVFQGGTDDVDNLQPLCDACHLAKGHSTANYRARPFAAHLDLPEPPRRGRPPSNQPPMRAVTIMVSPELKAWAMRQPGGISATARRAVEMGMRGEFVRHEQAEQEGGR